MWAKYRDDGSHWLSLSRSEPITAEDVVWLPDPVAAKAVVWLSSVAATEIVRILLTRMVSPFSICIFSLSQNTLRPVSFEKTSLIPSSAPTPSLLMSIIPLVSSESFLILCLLPPLLYLFPLFLLLSLYPLLLFLLLSLFLRAFVFFFKSLKCEFLKDSTLIKKQ